MANIQIPFTIDGNYQKSSTDYVHLIAGYLELKEANAYLYGHYKLDENPIDYTADAVIDSGTNNVRNPGTAYTLQNRIDTYSGAFSKYSSAYNFNAAYNSAYSYTNRIEIPTLNSLVNSIFSFSAWVTITTNSGMNVLASQCNGTSGENSWAVYWAAGAGNKIILMVEDDTNTIVYKQIGSMSYNELHHVVVNIDNDHHTVDCYVDNVKTTTTGITPIHSTSNPFTIGNHQNHYSDTNEQQWRGIIDDFKIFSWSLSDIDVAALYNSPNPYAKTLSTIEDSYAYTWKNFNTYGAINKITDFQIITGPEHNGSFLFNLTTTAHSNDDWYYWNGSAWAVSSNGNDKTQANTLADIQANIDTFPINNSNELYVKVWLITDGSTYPQLDEINIGVSTSTTESRGIKASINVPYTSSYGMKSTIKAPNIEGYGLKSNIKLPSPNTSSYGLKSAIRVPEVSSYGAKFNLPTQPTEQMESRGIKYEAYASHGAYKNTGMKFFIYSRDTAKRGIKFTVNEIAETARGLKYNIMKLTNVGMRFRIDSAWKYIDKLKSKVFEWIKID